MGKPDSQKLMRMLRLVGKAVVILAAIQLMYMVGRTAQVIYQNLPTVRHRKEASRPDGVTDVRQACSFFYWANKRGILERPPAPELEAAEMADKDGDGLSALEEFHRMTSDEFVDSDADGLADPVDPCPNGVASFYTEHVESAILSAAIRARRSTDGTVYCKTAVGGYLDIDAPESLAVVVDEYGLDLLRSETDALPFDPWRKNGIVSACQKVFIPGALYVYEHRWSFGGRCGGTSVQLFWDVPFVGPIRFAEWIIEIS